MCWSTNIILRELAACYRAARSKQPAGLAEPPSFSQYALDEASSTEPRATDLAYWTSLYKDIPPLPELPTDRPRPQQRTYAGATYTTQFDATLLASLRKTAAAHGATLFSTLFTALQVVIGRLTNASDVVIGVPVAAQAADGRSDLVGHCVSLLPFRSPLGWDCSFATAVRVAATRLAEGFDHRKCTYGSLVRALPVQRVTDRLPLTEIQFNLERMCTDIDLDEVAARVTPNAKAAVAFDMFINVSESAAGLRIDCDYSTDLFDEMTIARWLDHYRLALENVAAPETPLASMRLLTAEQERFALDTVNDTHAAYPAEKCIQDLFAAQAARAPDRLACIDDSGALTYAELDRRSTALAHALLKASPVRQGRIAVAVDRSRALLTSLLGVMKAGHAYVPLDARQPFERLRQIATTARVDGIICQDDAIAAVAPNAFALRLDRVDLERQVADVELPHVPSDVSAYLMFTSGSEGTPKGVEVSHRSLTNTLSCVTRLCEVTAEDVVIASSAITFDVSATELLGPPITGAHVVMADSEQVRTGVELIALAGKTQTTLLQATPTLWQMLIEAGFSSRPGMKMIAAGEPLSRDLADQLLSGGGRLWNLYGPTEAAIYSSGCELRTDGSEVAIGRPLANTQLYVLDERDQVALPGAFGTLFIGGDGLASGYFDRPELTARSFRAISLSGRSPRRLYCTGDRARLLPSGAFELRGRNDRQVKLRGFRIELEEIENTLRQTGNVRDCAVLLRHDVGPHPALVAYVVSSDGSPAAHRASLAQHLPDYMVPTYWVELESLPVTNSGKRDRSALPRPPEASRTAEPPATRPTTPAEVAIAAVWTEVLGRNDFGIDDPLFSVGADSLHIFRIAARLQHQNIAIDARELMKNPTIRALARSIQDKRRGLRDNSGVKAPSLADFRHGMRRHSVSS